MTGTKIVKVYLGHFETDGQFASELFRALSKDEAAFRQAAHDAVEITELKREIVILSETEDEAWERQHQLAQEALFKCGLCTCMEPLVDGRCEMCDPPSRGEMGEIDDGLYEWNYPNDGY